ncbi:uncharacterized protein EAF01_006219 [Botrytis porri]|uniref:Uncharacterized protein n=1 Tax=Botrytis porri TaxID=87229 RepID=A0A4Z1KWF3_9HELO|nr:uncharacterized protein EAF01_006219 [Botrytis porri]KAF7903170.1 hypothetical protein EAF01_006219 [Botrytis porri]TGO88857.1 hypothetical protein BPOR_0138g00180 [Botrytis porri]
MSDFLRSSSISSPSTRSAFSRRRFVTLKLADLPLTASSSIPPLSTRASTATSLSVGPLSVGSLPAELPLPSIEPSSKISISGRFPFPEPSLATSSSSGTQLLEPRLLEPRSLGTRLDGHPIDGPDYQVSNGSKPEVYHIDVKTFPTASPCTVYKLPALGYDASDIIAVIGKVPGWATLKVMLATAVLKFGRCAQPHLPSRFFLKVQKVSWVPMKFEKNFIERRNGIWLCCNKTLNFSGCLQINLSLEIDFF